MRNNFMVIFLLSFTITSYVEPREDCEECIDYFMLNEATILESRITEDPYSKYQPFYMTCNQDTCDVSLPRLNLQDGRIVIPCKTDDTCDIYYGCPELREDEDILNYNILKNLITMQKAEKIQVDKPYDDSFEYYADIYSYSCDSEVLPIFEKIPHPEIPSRFYFRIGFEIYNYGKVWMVEGYYKYDRTIPLYTRHIIYGKSLTAAPTKIPPRKEIFFDSDVRLENAFRKYYTSPRTITSHLQEAQLIPDHDMVHASWRKVPHFFHTMVPMLKEIYLNAWDTVEYAIRRAAFMLQKKLTVYSGTYGILEKKDPNKNQKNKLKYQIFLSMEYIIPVPQAFWKVIIDEENQNEPKRAIAIIVENLTDKMIEVQTYEKFQSKCNENCTRYNWIQFYSYKTVRCCPIANLMRMVPELRIDAKLEEYEVLEYPIRQEQLLDPNFLIQFNISP